jgi:hypothetical protein
MTCGNKQKLQMTINLTIMIIATQALLPILPIKNRAKTQNNKLSYLFSITYRIEPANWSYP